jgi:hypothetical protein
VSAKQARVAAAPRTAKRARITRTPDEGGRERVSWRLGNADLGGQYNWDSISAEDLSRVSKVLREVDKLHWSEASGDGMGQIKAIPVGKLSPDAHRRLEAIQRDDEEWLHEIRLGARPRLWGIRRGDIFHILWWDANHQVCPAALRNT